MKQVIGIFMAMVFVFVFASMALAENPKGYSDSEVYTMVEEWTKGQRLDVYYNEELDNGVKHMMGVLSTSDFKELTGEEFTIERLEQVYYEAEKYGLDFNATDVKIRLAGFYEGYDVYILDISTNEKPIGHEYGDNEQDYYHGSIVFMVCEDD